MEGDHARNLQSNLSINQLLVDEVGTLKATVLLLSGELTSMKTMITVTLTRTRTRTEPYKSTLHIHLDVIVALLNLTPRLALG